MSADHWLCFDLKALFMALDEKTVLWDSVITQLGYLLVGMRVTLEGVAP